jgi:hypothetical protein
MQKILAALFFVSVVFLMCLYSCVSHDFPEYECAEIYTFTGDVKPIIETKCAITGCHNGDMGQSLNWTNFETFHQRVESGLVKFRVTHRIMPPSSSPAGPLTQEQINAIACWADQGALNN